jgi:predicted DsbA family dithiol-disulfide isomerase/uncharacterized membrane protein
MLTESAMHGVTLGGWNLPRLLSAGTGVGMMVTSALSVQVYYAASYPATVAPTGWCMGGPLFSCDAAALSAVGAVGGIPIGWAGLVLGGAVLLGALLPSVLLERTNRALLMVNAVAVTGLFFYATLALQTLCLLCTAYGGFSLVAAGVFIRWRDGEAGDPFMPSPVQAGVVAGLIGLGGWGLAQYDGVIRDRDETVAGIRVVSHFYSLPQVPWPSEISPWRLYSAAEDFEAAPIRIVEFADPLCIDCRVLHEQLRQLEGEFAGRINLAYQFFPLEAACNDVVDKDKHPGSCDLSYIAAYDAAKFRPIIDEITDNMEVAKDRAWQLDLARRHGVEAALADEAVKARIHRLIRTGTEYEQTSDRYAHGIRSTPTMIINNRLIIGTMPTEHLRAIFRALLDEHENGGSRFMESWLSPGCVLASEGTEIKPRGT